MGTAEDYKVKKKLEELKSYKGVGTQLVSVYIPANYPIPEISARIREEINQAGNIKSKQTRTNVIGALERILNALKHFRKTPENGLVIFAGNVSENPSKTDIKTFIIEPPQRLNQSIYRCDSSFFLEPLEKMLASKDVYGIVVMDGREATLALLKGTQLDIVGKVHSTAHSKVRKGGQSARRYERLIEESTERYYKRIGEAMDRAFLGKTKGVIIGGPGPSKDFFLKMKPFNYQIKVIGVVDTGYVDEYGVREALSKAEKFIKEQEAVREKRMVEEFIKRVMKGELATYGVKEVIEAIKANRAELVLVSEGLEIKHYRMKCTNCSYEWEKITKEELEKVNCPKCSSPSVIIEEESLAEMIIELSKEHGTKVEVISTKTAEGAQFLHGFGGIGALLRY